jgi:hypothetical protein
MEKEIKYFGNTNLFPNKKAFWVSQKEINNIKNAGLNPITYYNNMLKNNPEKANYPKSLREYHKSVINELKMEMV